ncbi:MAG: hypothetical protein RLZZ316_2715 [Bacteroidota bacterium]|jgi:8-oxo-dGTP diphosphatase
MGTANQKTIQQIQSENSDFFRIAFSVDCVIFGFHKNELNVLLLKSDLEEFKDKWSLLGDLVRTDENLDDAPYRILQERTGLKDVFLEQVSTFGDIDRHPAGRVITTVYYSLINVKDHLLRLQHQELSWFPVTKLPQLAFDHYKILQTCIKKLQDKIDKEPVVFNLLPEKFSLRELQNLYEAILDTKLDRRNFRKKLFLMDWLEDAKEMEQDVPHRPGKLYHYRANTTKSATAQTLVQ